MSNDYEVTYKGRPIKSLNREDLIEALTQAVLILDEQHKRFQELSSLIISRNKIKDID